MLHICFTLLLFICLILNITANFTAAVVEFYPSPDVHLQPEDRLQKNIQSFLNILAEASHSNVDIIVFPESALSQNAVIRKRIDILPFSVEVMINGDSLCDSDEHTFLSTLACAAIDYKTYIVLNLDERSQCNLTSIKKCSPDGWDLYNTNVVLNRDGVIVSRYRKYNLFGEHYMNKTEQSDIAIFVSDFNITFATFTCFDILFKTPALDLVYKHDIKYILYPTMWFSELPFLTSLQSQMQWAYATNTVMLSSGLNNPRRGSGGTGIYSGMNGALTFDILGRTDSEVLVSLLSASSLKSTKQQADDIDKKAKQLDAFYCRTDDLTPYTSRLINVNDNEISETVCSNKFCCNFKITLQWGLMDDKNHYQYHMVAYSGTRSFAGIRNGGIEICGVIACVNNTLESCGKRFPNYDNISWLVTFKSITIQAKFDINDNKFQSPNSLLSNLQPIHVDATKWESTEKNMSIDRTFQLIKPQNRLMTFAIFGRDFSKDT